MNVNYIWNMKVHIFEDDETTVGKRALRPGLKWVVLNGTTAPDGRWQRFGGKASTICQATTTTTTTASTTSTTSAHPGPPPAAHVVEQEPELQQAPKTFEAALDRPLFQCCLHVLCQITQLFMNRCPSPRGRCPSWGWYGQRRAYGQTENISLFLGKVDVLKSWPPVSWSCEYLTWVAGLNYEDTCLQI